MNTRRKGREVNGILLLDKPIGLTSNQALTKAKILFQAKKAGHTGSLDPLACGMLPICFGEATKFSQFLLDADKHYLVEGKLGIKTTTGDAEGEIVAKTKVAVSQAQLHHTLEAFRGEILQVPSMYSAIKYQGKPLYAYARQGIEIERQSRKVIIKELNLLRFVEESLVISVKCSKGTYIRTLIEDIGEALGCGAYVTSLRRTCVDPYENLNMITLAELEEMKDSQEALDIHLHPVDSALVTWPEVKLNETISFYIKQGQAVIVPHAPSKGWVRLLSDEGLFLGVGEILNDGRVAPRRLLVNNRVSDSLEVL